MTGGGGEEGYNYKAEAQGVFCTGTHNRAKYCIVFIYLFCWPHHMACGILVSQSGMEPTPPALKAES